MITARLLATVAHASAPIADAPGGLAATRLDGTTAQVSAPIDWAWWLTALGVLLAVNAAGYLLLRWLRRPRTERAFVLASVRAGLNRRARADVRALAAALGAPPIALLLSEGAFTRAQRSGAPVPAERCAALHRRLFE